MNWRADVNELVKGFKVGDKHLHMAETCGYLGLCAKTEASVALTEAIEDFLKWPILEITGLACGGEVEFHETYLVGESYRGCPFTMTDVVRARYERVAKAGPVPHS